jgi:hypothetical protein
VAARYRYPANALVSRPKVPVSVLVKERKTMIAENLLEDPPVSVPAAATPGPLFEITHDLKNCMSILLYWVETFETDRDSTVRNEESLDDLKKLARKMNCLIERLSAS